MPYVSGPAVCHTGGDARLRQQMAYDAWIGPRHERRKIPEDVDVLDGASGHALRPIDQLSRQLLHTFGSGQRALLGAQREDGLDRLLVGFRRLELPEELGVDLGRLVLAGPCHLRKRTRALWRDQPVRIASARRASGSPSPARSGAQPGFIAAESRIACSS